MAAQCQRIGSDGDAVRSASHHERGHILGCDQRSTSQVKGNYCTQAIKFLKNTLKDAQRVFFAPSQFHLQEMSDHFRISVGLKGAPFAGKIVLELAEVLDNSVVDDCQPT